MHQNKQINRTDLINMAEKSEQEVHDFIRRYLVENPDLDIINDTKYL